MDEDEQPGRRQRPWLAWGLVATAAVGALWLASLPLDERLPAAPDPPGLPPVATPEVRREAIPRAPSATPTEPEPTLAPPAAEPPRTDEALVDASPALPPAAPDPGPYEAPHTESEPPPATVDTRLRTTMERQLAMNDLGGVRVEIDGDRVITSGWLPHADERVRVRLLIRALAPELIHQDRTVVAREGAAR
jgi:hypothetical protein